MVSYIRTEAGGFEPSVGVLAPTPDYKSGALIHSATPLVLLKVERAGVEPAGAGCEAQAREPSVLPTFLLNRELIICFILFFFV